MYFMGQLKPEMMLYSTRDVSNVLRSQARAVCPRMTIDHREKRFDPPVTHIRISVFCDREPRGTYLLLKNINNFSQVIGENVAFHYIGRRIHIFVLIRQLDIDTGYRVPSISEHHI